MSWLRRKSTKKAEEPNTNASKIAEMNADPDMIEERRILKEGGGAANAVSTKVKTETGHHVVTTAGGACPFGHARLPQAQACPLNVVGGSHRHEPATAELLRQIGGPEVIHKITDAFYKRVFQDKVLQLFFNDFNDPHAVRLASWYAHT
jgi:hypothetical protein